MARTSNGARLTLATWLQPRPDRPATIPLPPDVTVRIGRVDGQAPADSAGVHVVGLNSREHSAMWKTRPAWPASMHAAQAAGWPRLAEARGSLSSDRGLWRASWSRSEPPWFPHRHSEHKDLLSRRHAEISWQGTGAVLFRDGNPARPASSCNGSPSMTHSCL